MSSFNHVTFVGNATRDAELKYLPSGGAVAEFGIAVNNPFKKNDEAMFLDCTLFGKAAESVSQYIQKGKPVLVSGRLVQERWEKDGQKRSKFKVVANDVVLLGSKPKQDEQQPEPATVGGDLPF